MVLDIFHFCIVCLYLFTLMIPFYLRTWVDWLRMLYGGVLRACLYSSNRDDFQLPLVYRHRHGIYTGRT